VVRERPTRLPPRLRPAILYWFGWIRTPHSDAVSCGPHRRGLGSAIGRRFLKGDNPADLPVQQAVKVELIVNLKTAKALGIEMPLSLLMRISEAIE
jgi:ABC transporter substrate binding protein